MSRPRKPRSHGTASNYTFGCRCSLCREAKRQQYLAWKLAARQTWGTTSSKQNRGTGLRFKRKEEYGEPAGLSTNSP